MIDIDFRDLNFRRARILTKRVHHIAHRLDLLHDRLSRAIEDLGLCSGFALQELATNTLG